MFEIVARTNRMRRAMKNCGQRLKYPSIDIRPPIVEERERLGDYERDTIIGSGMHKGHVLLTIVDRVSRMVRIRKMPKIDANIAHHTTVRLLEGLTVHTLTNDNGPEFAEYARTADALEAQVYFNDPYSSWQRGTNENMSREAEKSGVALRARTYSSESEFRGGPLICL